MPSTAEIIDLQGNRGLLRSWWTAKKTQFAGIDIGVRSVRMATLATDPSNAGAQQTNSLAWVNKHEFALPINPTNAAPQDWVQRVVATLQEHMPRCVESGEYPTCISLPSAWVHYQIASLSEIEAVGRQCDAMFQSSLFKSKSHLATWPLEVLSSSKQQQVMIVATATDAAFDIAEVIRRQGYNVRAIMPRAHALSQAAKALTNLDSGCIVRLQSNGGLVTINRNGECGISRVLPSLPKSELEDLLTNQLTLDSLFGWLSKVAQEVNSTIRYAQRSSNSVIADDSPILLCGELASIPGIAKSFASLLQRPTALWTLMGWERPSMPDSLPTENAESKSEAFFDEPEFASALSLAFAAKRMKETK